MFSRSLRCARRTRSMSSSGRAGGVAARIAPAAGGGGGGRRGGPRVPPPPPTPAAANLPSESARGGDASAATSAGPRAPAAGGGTLQLTGARVTEDAGAAGASPPRVAHSIDPDAAGRRRVSARGEGGEQARADRQGQVAEGGALEGGDACQGVVGEPGAALLAGARRP